jgi:hypothetical protein
MPAYEIIDVGEVQEPSEDEQNEIVLDIVFALLDKHEVLTITALNEMVNQLIMQHGLREGEGDGGEQQDGCATPSERARGPSVKARYRRAVGTRPACLGSKSEDLRD